MSTTPTVSLLEVEPELGAWLSAEERQIARQLVVPTARLGTGSPELDRVLEESGAFAALLLGGMVMHRITVGDRQILRLLGPGDIIVHTWAPRSEILGYTTKRAAGHAHIALLGRPLVNAARHFPGLIVGLHLRLGDQHQRLAVQLGICQLPRVQDRVLTLMWLLAESWGRVTPTGTRLPVKLTHTAIGELIGARRPTVSLALRDLVEQGALLPQEGGWLLLKTPPTSSQKAPPSGAPEILEEEDPVAWDDAASAGAGPAPLDGTGSFAPAQLGLSLQDLHAVHASQRDQARASVARARHIQERSRLLQAQVAQRRAHNGTTERSNGATDGSNGATDGSNGATDGVTPRPDPSSRSRR